MIHLPGNDHQPVRPYRRGAQSLVLARRDATRVPPRKIIHDRLGSSIVQAAARHHDLRRTAGRWGAYRARLAVNSRTRPDSTGHNEGRPSTVSVLVKDRSCCVAGQGFEPWKASADGFTVLCSSGGARLSGAGQWGYAASVGPSWFASCQFRAISASSSLRVPCGCVPVFRALSSPSATPSSDAADARA